MADNGTLVFNTLGNIPFDGDISGSGGLVMDGTGMLTLSGTNTYIGGTTVNAGDLCCAQPARRPSTAP